MAAGLTVETAKIDLLRQRLIAQAEKQITDDMLQKTLKIDLSLPLFYVTEKLWEETRKMAPFGIGNPEPSFSSKAVVKDFRKVGNDGKHLKLELQGFSAIGFGMGYLAGSLKIDQEVEIAYNLSLNVWNNQKKVEVKIKDLKWMTSKN